MLGRQHGAEGKVSGAGELNVRRHTIPCDKKVSKRSLKRALNGEELKGDEKGQRGLAPSSESMKNGHGKGSTPARNCFGLGAKSNEEGKGKERGRSRL